MSALAIEQVCRCVHKAFAKEAAKQLSVPIADLRTQQGQFFAGKQSISYGELASFVDLSSISVNDALQAQAAHEAHTIDVKRLDFTSKFSSAAYIHDLRLPGLVHARIVRGPHPFSKALSVPLAQLQALAQVKEVFQDGDFLALLSDNEEALESAQQKAVQLIKWDTPALPSPFNQESLLEQPCITSTAHESGDWAGRDDSNHKLELLQLKQTYSRPYLAHASIGPSCALARPAQNGEPLTVWSHSQGVFKLREQIAKALSLPMDSVRVIHTPGAGCYGHNGADDVAFDAALIAHKRNQTVRVQWSRQEELTHSPMGSASVIQIQAQIDQDANLTYWQTDVWSHTHLARPGWGEGVNLLGAWSMQCAQPSPKSEDVPLPTGGGLRNAIPEYDIASLRIRHHFVERAPLRVSALRSLGAHANVFAIESFIDELCESARIDPVEFRLRHLRDERAKSVIKEVANLSEWSSRGEPGSGIGMGIGYARYKNRAGYCAVVLRVEVSEHIKVLNAWACVDAGRIFHKDGLLNQIEGGILQSLSWSLKESVQWDEQGVNTNSWENYPILSFTEVPTLEVKLLDSSTHPPLGAGEVATGPTAAALANALSHAIGLRVRDMPLTPQRLLQTIHQTN
jgi:CO/xanthine dehydrogenase Mo-binding subunit